MALVYQEAAADRGAALRREHEIKRLAPQAKRALVAKEALATAVNRYSEIGAARLPGTKY